LGGEGPPDWLLERLVRAAAFTVDVTKPNGRVAQIGDNDSGRFIVLQPTESLDHRELVGAIGGLLGRDDLLALAGPYTQSAAVIRALAGRSRTVPPPSGHMPPAHPASVGPAVGTTRRLVIPVGPSARAGLRAIAYPDFGLWLYRTDRIFLAIRCGSVGLDGIGGHAHNDQLAIELSVDGQDWIRDPGTFVYTPLPERRNAYRSVAAHFVPRVGVAEPSDLSGGLFRLERPAVGVCLRFDAEAFVGSLRTREGGLRSEVRLEDDRIVVDYTFDGVEPDPRLDAGDWRALLPSVTFSPGYGELEA
jgi:hypothetical protein